MSSIHAPCQMVDPWVRRSSSSSLRVPDAPGQLGAQLLADGVDVAVGALAVRRRHHASRDGPIPSENSQ